MIFLVLICRTYNPEDGRGSKKPATRDQAMKELVEVVSSLQPDKFTPTIIKQTDDYLYAEYQSPTFGVSCDEAGLDGIKGFRGVWGEGERNVVGEGLGWERSGK